MAEVPNSSCRSLHPAIQDAYSATHGWLRTRSEAQGYATQSYDSIKNGLEEQSLLSAAGQFRAYFPGHCFKVLQTLEAIIEQDTLIEWLRHNPRICLMDIGCGAGAGSAAFVQSIMRLQESGRLPNRVEIFCLGIDPNPHAIALYYRFMGQIKERAESATLVLELEARPEGIPDATSSLIHRLNEIRQQWQLPNLSHVFVMQVNVVSPLSKKHEARQSSYDILKNYEIDLGTHAVENEQFGVEESLAYKSIFEGVAIDNMHIITVATRNYMLDARVIEMGQAIQQTFSSSRHHATLIGEGQQQVTYYNPQSSLWGSNHYPYTAQFHVNVMSITNQELREDGDWHEVISEENLRLAWARARRELLREAFVDEIEIRLFESNLDRNLARIRQQLIAYAAEVARTDDYIAYKVPKNATQARPRGLSRLEEEIISVAIVQKLGSKVTQLRGSSYAYRISHSSRGRDTEYLYTSWFNAYQNFIDAAREAAKRTPDCVVLREDIRSFYTRIVQEQLIEVTQVLTQSRRIHWLIKLLLAKDLDLDEAGRGLAQGGIGSGFYANIYLTSIDMLFGTNNEWGVKFFRYVDDMVFVIPEPTDGRNIDEVVDEVINALDGGLRGLGLELNRDKEELYHNASEFLNATESDQQIEDISESYEAVTNPLFILDAGLREHFIRNAANDELWWFWINQYRQCLLQLGIYELSSNISRRVYRYLFDDRKRNRELKISEELVFGELPAQENDNEFEEWSTVFGKDNGTWLVELQSLRSMTTLLLEQSWREWSSSDSLAPNHERILQTRIRFAINKLAVIGFGEAGAIVVAILQHQPWLVREPMRVIENLARHGYVHELPTLLNHYENETHEMNEYLRASVLRAIRFLPEVDSEILQLLTNYAVEGSLVEKLMATESLEYLRERQKLPPGHTLIQAIQGIAVTDSPIPNRLIKNYALLMQGDDKDLIRDLGFNGDDPMLLDIREYIESSDDEEASLFSYEEPAEIRENYYSGRRADDVDFRDY